MGRVRVDVLRVGSGTGMKSTGRVYPFLPVKNTIVHDVGAEQNKWIKQNQSINQFYFRQLGP